MDAEGNANRIYIPQYKCPSCGHYHVGLPEFLIPHRHYEASVIQAVVTNERDEDGRLVKEYVVASEKTIRRWEEWYETLEEEAVAALVREEALDAVITSGSSLLERYRATHRYWLSRIVVMIYETGGS